MSHIIENYLNDLYLYEELIIIDENFITWAKRFRKEKLMKIVDKMKNAFERRDMQKVKSIASKIPKPSIENLEKMAKKLSPNFIRINREASRQIKQKFSGVSDAEIRLISFIVAIINTNTDNIIKSVGETIKKLKKIIKTPKVKKLAGGGEASVGSSLVIAAGVLGMGAFAMINFPVLMAALLVGGIALGFLMEAAGKHA